MSSSTSGASSGGAGRQPFRIASAPRASDKPSVTLSTPQRTTGRVDTSTLAGVMEASRTPERAPSPTVKAATPVTVEDRIAGMSSMERRQATQLGRADAPRVMAIGELTERLASDRLANIPGTAGALAGAVSRTNLENQIKQLRDFGTPVFDTDTGKTVGVVNKAGQFSGDTAFQEAALKAKKSGSIELSRTNVLEEARLASKEDRQPAQVAAEEEEVAAQDTTALGGAGRGRGTRGKRFGAGGTILEGTGALYD